jgi:hypothetical protein
MIVAGWCRQRSRCMISSLVVASNAREKTKRCDCSNSHQQTRRRRFCVRARKEGQKNCVFVVVVVVSYCVIDPWEAITWPYLTEQKTGRSKTWEWGRENFNNFHVRSSCNRFSGVQSIIPSTVLINLDFALEIHSEVKSPVASVFSVVNRGWGFEDWCKNNSE